MGAAPPPLARGHTVIVQICAALGLSHPAGGYDKKTAGDVAASSTRSRSPGRSRHPRHRNVVGYAFAAASRDVSRNSPS